MGESVFSFRVDSILKWRVYIKLKVSWLRAFLWCISQTSRDRVNSRRVRTHEKNSGDAARRLGTIIQSIFCAQSGASIHLTVWKWPVRVGTQGLVRLCLKTFVGPFLPAPMTAPGSPSKHKEINYRITHFPSSFQSILFSYNIKNQWTK